MTCCVRLGASLKHRLGGLALLTSVLFVVGGCPIGNAPSTLDEPGNNSIRNATALPNQPAEEWTFRGTIDSGTDIDVYSLGTLDAGDRLFIDVQTTRGDLDPVAAVFDEQEDLVAFNDDRGTDTTSAADLNPQLDVILPGDVGQAYLGLIAYPGTTTNGDYEVIIRITRAVGMPTRTTQLVYLNWAGGQNVSIPNVGTFDLQPFAASDVGLSDGDTEALKDGVQAALASRFAGYNITILNSDDDAEPTGDHSTIHFGGFNRVALGISEQIDTFNVDPTDEAIIFSESYIGAFGATPTLAEMTTALGNTVAHELAHLLGLVHTHDCESLMDSTCSNIALLSLQEFTRAPLDWNVFPFGYQDAEQLLEWVLGLAGP